MAFSMACWAAFAGAAALIALALLGGCGQKGPLYLPGDPSEMQTSVPVQNTASQDESEEEDEDN